MLTMKLFNSAFKIFTIVLFCVIASVSVEAQNKALPSNIRFVGTVNYDYGYAQARQVKCFLDIKISKETVSGHSNYNTDWDGNPGEVTGTIKALNNGSYYLDVYFTDNSGCDFEGTFNPKTGVFSGQFSGRGMEKTYPFKFVKDK